MMALSTSALACAGVEPVRALALLTSTLASKRVHVAYPSCTKAGIVPLCVCPRRRLLSTGESRLGHRTGEIVAD
jgi:hypothetical protein